mmetsp:Transcript_8087/g.21152  ORF Transcript_8087/g.21152 Transcript_8087/m.21152 type:complete len:297 (-) Transcript_8087:444-1334(-)
MLPLLTLSIGLVLSSSRLSAPPRLESLPDAQNGQVVRVPAFLSPQEISELCEAAESQGDASRQDIHKRQGAPKGSWFTVFLNHKLRLLFPSVHDRMFEAAREADMDAWQLLDSERHELAMRCVEYHSVTTGGGIPMKKHHDYGSLLTLDIMLSDPGSDFEGGDFCTVAADGLLQPQTFEAGDLLIFNSHQYHCVQPVTSGLRRVLVSEIWEGLERRCVRRCNVPWGPCECQFQPPPKKYVNADQLTKVKPTLRLMSKTDGELIDLAAKNAEEGQLVGSHSLWKRLQALDKLKSGAS